MSRFWSAVVHGLTPYVPGEQPKLDNLVKLNTNEHPYGPSPQALDAIRAATGDGLRLYPDPNGDALKTALAKRFGVQAKQVFVGAIDSLAVDIMPENERAKASGTMFGLYDMFSGYNLSQMTVFAPTMMASTCARSLCASRRAAALVIHFESPVKHAILPSILKADFRVMRGRPVRCRCKKARLSVSNCATSGCWGSNRST